MALDHGIMNEINATATIVGRIMPVLEPDLVFCEEGFVSVKYGENENFIIVSPDGSLRKDTTLESTSVAVEIKCQVNRIYTVFPPRYLLQCLGEIEVLNACYLLFVTWTQDETFVYKVERNQQLFTKATKLATMLYGDETPKRPTKLNDDQKTLKELILKESKAVKILGRFKSCTNAEGQENEFADNNVKTIEIADLLIRIKKCITTHYELVRERASEAVVFIVADLDRSWESEQIRSAPVAWFPKGYSLPNHIMRNIAEHVHSECHQNGIYIPCESFDGQWHGLVVRTINNEPLTVHQLHRDVWRKVESTSKKDIINKIKEINKSPYWLSEEVLDEQSNEKRKVIMASIENTTIPRIKADMFIHGQTLSDKNSGCNANDGGTLTLADVMPFQVQTACDLSSCVLSLSKIDSESEIEAFKSNINDQEWIQQIVSIEDEEPLNTVDEIKDANRDNQTRTPNDSIKTLCDADYNSILTMMQTSESCNRKGKWDGIDLMTLRDKFVSMETLQTFLDVELRIIVRYLRQTMKNKNLKESESKRVKLKKLSELLGFSVNIQEAKQRQSKHILKVKTLAELSLNVVAKYPKHILNVVMAETEWEKEFEYWSLQMKDVKVNGEEYDWFYKPEFSESRNQFEVKCIDSTHLLTRARRKSCHGGLDGLPNTAWLRVAQSKKTLLTPAMITEITDPMSSTMARTHFSEAVEKEMRKNGDYSSADLCKNIRKWWEAEDRPGVPNVERVNMRKGLKARLLALKDFRKFPPVTTHVNGWPVQLWEALLASIDAKALLYAFSPNGQYNVRAFSSLIGETFFSEVALHDKRGLGTLTATEFAQHIGNTIEQLQIRLDPNRSFQYCTSKKAVYDVVDGSDSVSPAHHGLERDSVKTAISIPMNILTVDHHFDSESRRRVSCRRKDATVHVERNALQKGALGVRWEKARCNLSKILPTTKMGLNTDCCIYMT